MYRIGTTLEQEEVKLPELTNPAVSTHAMQYKNGKKFVGKKLVA